MVNLKGACFVFLLFLVAGKLSSQSNLERIADYLDSCTYYLSKSRPDLVIKFNMKADYLSSQEEELPFDVNYSIHNNYIWAFGAINNNSLKQLRLRRLIELLRKEKTRNSSHFIRYQIALGDIASSFSYEGQLDSATKYYQLGIKLANENNDTTYLASSLNNMGYYLATNGNWERAKDYFDKAIHTTNLGRQEDSILYCSIRDNIADYYFYKGDSLRAINLVEKNMKYLRVEVGTQEKLIRWGEKLLRCYINLHRYDKADSLIEKQTRLISNDKSLVSYEQKKSLLKSNLIVVEGLQDFEKLDHLQKQLNVFLEEYSLLLKERTALMNKTLLEYTAQSAQKEMNLAQAKIEEVKQTALRNRILLFSFVIVSLLIISLLVINYKRKIAIEYRDKKLNVKQLEIEKLERKRVQFELENKSKDFSKLLMQSTLQEDWSKYLVKKLQGIGDYQEEQIKTELKDLVLELKQKSGMYEKLHKVQKGMEEANTQFFFALEAKFPTLTKAEKETCGLIRMDMQTDEIAQIRNINPSSVKKLRHRIRTKIGLGSEFDLYQFIQSI